jgi:hypothetical protein
LFVGDLEAPFAANLALLVKLQADISAIKRKKEGKNIKKQGSTITTVVPLYYLRAASG